MWLLRALQRHNGEPACRAEHRRTGDGAGRRRAGRRPAGGVTSTVRRKPVHRPLGTPPRTTGALSRVVRPAMRSRPLPSNRPRISSRGASIGPITADDGLGGDPSAELVPGAHARPVCLVEPLRARASLGCWAVVGGVAAVVVEVGAPRRSRTYNPLAGSHVIREAPRFAPALVKWRCAGILIMAGSRPTCVEFEHERRPKRQIDHVHRRPSRRAWRLLGRIRRCLRGSSRAPQVAGEGLVSAARGAPPLQRRRFDTGNQHRGDHQLRPYPSFTRDDELVLTHLADRGVFADSKANERLAYLDLPAAAEGQAGRQRTAHQNCDVAIDSCTRLDEGQPR